jgi:hypothetical protein
MCNTQLEGERLAALISTGPGNTGQVGQGPGNPYNLMSGACADLPEIDGAADGGEHLGSRRVRTAQLSSGDVARAPGMR